MRARDASQTGGQPTALSLQKPQAQGRGTRVLGCGCEFTCVCQDTACACGHGTRGPKPKLSCLSTIIYCLGCGLHIRPAGVGFESGSQGSWLCKWQSHSWRWWQGWFSRWRWRCWPRSSFSAKCFGCFLRPPNWRSRLRWGRNEPDRFRAPGGVSHACRRGSGKRGDSRFDICIDVVRAVSKQYRGRGTGSCGERFIIRASRTSS